MQLELRELLGSPVSILLGVSDAAETALAEIGIRSVFDLGASWLFANARAATKAASAHALGKSVTEEAAGPKPVTSATPSLAATTRTWDTSAVALASRYVARPLLRAGSDALHFPDDTELLGLTFASVAVRRIQLDRFGAAAVDDTFDVPGDSARLDLPKPVRLAELARIFVAKSGDTTASGSMTLECSYLGRHFSTPPIPIELDSGTVLQSLTTDEEDRKRELLAHLRANQTHYSQVIFRALDSAMIVSLLSPFDWNGRHSPIRSSRDRLRSPATISCSALRSIAARTRASEGRATTVTVTAR